MAKRILKRLSTDELLAEVNRRRRDLPGLKKKRQRLARELAEVDQRIASLGGGGASKTVTRGRKKKGSKKKRRRAKNKISLVDAIAKSLNKERPKDVGTVVADVKKAGYKSSSAAFRSIVAQTLSKDDRFKRVDRGQYVLAG